MTEVNWGPIADRFWAKVDTSAGLDGCWPWMGARMPRGYGKFGISEIKRGPLLAHRVAVWLTQGPDALPSDKLACHHCDNPPCVNPRHLFIGTASDNVQDMLEKGRGTTAGAPGEQNSHAKVSESDVRDIRALYASGFWLQRDLGEVYGLSQAAVSAIVRGATWQRIGA